MANVAVYSLGEVRLDDLIEAWLNTPAHPFALRFPPLLEQRFEADTGADRSRTMMIFGLLGFLLGTLLYPIIASSLPDIAGQCRSLYLETSMPLGFALSACVGVNPPPVLREGMMLAANLVCICVSIYLFAISQTNDAPTWVAGVTILMVYSAIGIQLRFPYALAALTVVLIAYGAALHWKHGIGPGQQINLISEAAVTAAYLMLANWRLERESRRSYLLILRERIQRQDLSLRNTELDELARRDALTGLANRRAYDAWLAGAWAQEAGAPRGRLGLIVIDIDHFKAFNDFYGHAAGDACLKQIALCLRDQLRGTSDLVARLGGEEFAVLLPSLTEDLCADIAERIRVAVEALEVPHQGLGQHNMLTVSLGAASHLITSRATPASLFEAADAALYEAKITGRNRVCMATIAHRASIAEPVIR